MLQNTALRNLRRSHALHAGEALHSVSQIADNRGTNACHVNLAQAVKPFLLTSPAERVQLKQRESDVFCQFEGVQRAETRSDWWKPRHHILPAPSAKQPLIQHRFQRYASR